MADLRQHALMNGKIKDKYVFVIATVGIEST